MTHVSSIVSTEEDPTPFSAIWQKNPAPRSTTFHISKPSATESLAGYQRWAIQHAYAYKRTFDLGLAFGINLHLDLTVDQHKALWTKAAEFVRRHPTKPKCIQVKEPTLCPSDARIHAHYVDFSTAALDHLLAQNIDDKGRAELAEHEDRLRAVYLTAHIKALKACSLPTTIDGRSVVDMSKVEVKGKKHADYLFKCGEYAKKARLFIPNLGLRKVVYIGGVSLDVSGQWNEVKDEVAFIQEYHPVHFLEKQDYAFAYRLMVDQGKDTIAEKVRLLKQWMEGV